MNYISAALNASHVFSWSVVARDNPASNYPSDFEVLKVSLESQRTPVSGT